MRKTTRLLPVIFIPAFLFTAFHLVAQSNKHWSIGPEVGINLSKYKWDVTDTQFKLGGMVGLSANYSTSNTFGIAAKVLFFQKGNLFELEDNNGSSLNYKVTLNYLEVPVLGRYFVIKEGKFRPNLFAGPSFGFLLGGTTKEGNPNAVKINDYKKSFNTFELGVTGGLGVSYAIANATCLLLDARYAYGLTDIIKGAGHASIYNRTIGISAGVSFGI